MIKNVVAIYPGRFQPFGKHHAAAFKWLQQHFDGGNCYIATSNVIDLPKSPFSFKDKADIIRHYGFDDRLVQVKNPYKAEEIMRNYRPEDTAVVFMVGAKDMKEDPRFKISKKKDGSDSYFQEYEKNKSNLQPFNKHGYLVVAPHVSVSVPGYGEMSGTTMRKALGNVKTPRSQKINLFKSIFGWYDEKLAKMIFDKLESLNESKLTIAEVMKKKNLKMETTQPDQTKLFSKEWWSESLDLTEDISIEDIKSKFDKFIKAIKQEGQETKEAFNLLILAATGKKTLTDAEQKQIGDQLKDVLKTIGLTAIAVMPGGFIAGILIKVLKAEKYITPSSFMEGYMSPEQQKAHESKIQKLRAFLQANIGREFAYNFDEFPKTVYGVNIEESLIMEGGAGGHMAHPFNIPTVKTGKDLVTVFQQSIEYLQKGPASVKIDGVNASIRLITLDGQKVFVMDRGSNKPLDVKGITKAELTDRFGDGHGMIKVGGTVLDIFNEAIPKITPALKKLGLWENPNIMFNLEYVAGSTNVLSYNKNFLAVHGLLEIAQVTPTKRATKEKTYNKSSMQDLLNNLVQSASKRGYEVLGSIPTTLESTPDLSKELSKPYTVNYGDKKETKTLSQWLAKATIPDGDIKTVDGKRIAALSKDVLIKISDGIALPEYIADPKDYKDAVDGFVIYIATMKLGDAILEKLNSPLGPVSEHEGIVIRDPKIYNKPFKITGKFILGGLATSFRK